MVWHVSWSITGNILAVSGGDNKVKTSSPAGVPQRGRSQTQASPSSACFLQVTLWKESMDGQWACISDVSKGQSAVSAITDTQQSEQ